MYDLEITPEGAGWGFCGLRVLSLAPGDTRTLRDRRGRADRAAARGRLHGDGGRRDVPLTGRAGVFDGPTDFVYAPREAHVEIASAGRRARRAALLARAAAARAAPRGRGRDRDRAARGGPDEPRGPQLLLARGVRRRPPDRGRGDHPRRQLVLLSPAQARRGDPGRRRPRSRRSTTSRSPTAASPTSAPTARGSTSSRRSAAATTCCCPAATTGRRWPRPATTSTT